MLAVTDLIKKIPYFYGNQNGLFVCYNVSFCVFVGVNVVWLRFPLRKQTLGNRGHRFDQECEKSALNAADKVMSLLYPELF
jgi:hypothetical protein